MFKIGDFAKLAQVSTHRLRNYDKHGLLQPVLLQWSAKAGYLVSNATREVHHASAYNTVMTPAGDPVLEYQLPIEKIAS